MRQNFEPVKRDEPGKTRLFVKKGLVLWVIMIVIFVLLKILVFKFGDLGVKNSRSGFFGQLSGIILISGIFGIPLTLFLSIVLKFAEKMIDRIGSDKSNEK